MKILYHGSPCLFESFDYDKIGQNASAEGYGFYFTNNVKVAMNYAEDGYLYIVNFTGTKPISHLSKTITRSQLTRFMRKLHSESELGFLDNYDDISYYGFNHVLKKAVNMEYGNRNDVDMLASICNTYGSKEPLRILYELYGYDHICNTVEWNHGTDQSNTVYVALVNDIVSIQRVYLIDDTIRGLLSSDTKHRYIMLGRFQSDCEYYLGYGCRSPHSLWAHDEQKQLDLMMMLYNSFDEKPVWCPLEKIQYYQQEMGHTNELTTQYTRERSAWGES